MLCNVLGAGNTKINKLPLKSSKYTTEIDMFKNVLQVNLCSDGSMYHDTT